MYSCFQRLARVAAQVSGCLLCRGRALFLCSGWWYHSRLQVWAVMNTAAMNVRIQVFESRFSFLLGPKRRITRLYGKNMFVKNCQIVFQSSCTILQSPHQRNPSSRRSTSSSAPVLPVVFGVAILVGVQCSLSVVAVCTRFHPLSSTHTLHQFQRTAVIPRVCNQIGLFWMPDVEVLFMCSLPIPLFSFVILILMVRDHIWKNSA